MPRKRLLSAAILLLLLVTAIIFVGVMIWWTRTNQYDYVEVREYEGQDLSPINFQRKLDQRTTICR